MRCGKCGPCRRWVVSLDRSEVCELAAKTRAVRPIEADRSPRLAVPTIPQMLRELEETLRGASAL